MRRLAFEVGGRSTARRVLAAGFVVLALTASACADPSGDESSPPAVAPSAAAPSASPTDVDSFPSAASTGARDPLNKVTGIIQVSDDGLMIQNLDLAGHIEIDADDVTVRNVRISSSDYWPIIIRGQQTRIENTTIVGALGSQACIGDGGGSVFVGLDLSGAPDGIKIGNNSTLSDSYIHDLGTAPGNHNDGVEFQGTTGVTVRHNTILNSNAQTSAVFIGGNNSPTTDVTVEDNLLAGGGYTIYGPAGRTNVPASSNVRVVDNKLSTRFYPRGGQYGPVSYWQAGGGNSWSGNIWVDGPSAGAQVPS